ncbi:DUF3298 and DUF4163 domain-containing protein [Fulvivirgaceae bacterium BMA12]|uniref:DUF3298 and DUF4163 domain-containing protein n=1 Tax=Agaribacillus aureus TaxID=3051825 RepID=A0ABT8L4C5_9BACT|nr:DUF3298 and DUF4163 domain-containing protein [Fulvivirgaceae bacterium BMA12]
MRSLAIFSILIISIVSFSCTDSSNKNNDEKIVDEAVDGVVVYTAKSIRDEDPACSDAPEHCAKIIINFPEITDVPATLNKERLNKEIKKAILASALNPEGKLNSIDKACKLFLADFADFKKAMQQQVPAWSIEIDVEVINNDNNYLSLQVNENSYMGGAHPNQFTSFLNFDSRTGEKINLKALIKDTGKLEVLAEQAFRKTKKLADAENLSEAGYFFEEGKFKISDNFGISQGKLLLYYNSYEIAPYSLGPTLLQLPLEKVL